MGEGSLATFGIVPLGLETGFGYISRGAALSSCDGCYRGERFDKKPDLATAKAFVADGGYYWNSRLFMFTAELYLGEPAKFVPEIAAASEKAINTGYRDLDFWRVDEAAFSRCPSNSIDYSLMEHERCSRDAGRYRLERCRLVVGAVGSAAARRERQRLAWRCLP